MIRTAFFILIAVTLFSCTGGSDMAPLAPITIVGKWTYVSDRQQVVDTTGAVLSDVTVTSFPAGAYLQFNNDGTGMAADGSGGMLNFTYVLNGTIETEYQTPKVGGAKPHVYTIVLGKTTLTRHSTTKQGTNMLIEDTDLSR